MSDQFTTLRSKGLINSGFLQRSYVQGYQIGVIFRFDFLKDFSVKSHLYLVYTVVFVELLAEANDLHTLKQLICDS